MNLSMPLLKRIILQLKKTNQKYVTVDDLSQQLGIYPDKIAEVISYFNPLILMDLTSNLKDHLEQMEIFLNSKIAPKEVKKTKTTRIDIKAYKTIIDFIYQHMTIDGIIDKTRHLSSAELKAMKKLITEELKSKKTSH